MFSFFTIFFSLYTLVHAYLAVRLGRLPWILAHGLGKWVVIALILLAFTFPLSRFIDRPGFQGVANSLEAVGTYWLGIVFIFFWVFLLVDLLTVFGVLFKAHLPMIRYGTALAATAIAVFAVIQGTRAPVVTEYDVALPNLPSALNGFRLVLISDLHLGSRIGVDWLEKTIAQIHALKPDAIAIAGDLIDHDNDQVLPMIPMLKTLHAPNGVFSVVGNHEYYAGDRVSAEIMAAAGYKTLRNQSAPIVPGLNITGVDDLSIARRRSNAPDAAYAVALGGRAQGASILITHSPIGADIAANSGVGLMVCGHTHNGQIWPFNYLVRTQFDMIYGAYKRGAMTAIISRGAGGWGPRMRLWSPGEIVLIRLHPQGQ